MEFLAQSSVGAFDIFRGGLLVDSKELGWIRAARWSRRRAAYFIEVLGACSKLEHA